jgi:hypothetical protein
MTQIGKMLTKRLLSQNLKSFPVYIYDFILKKNRLTFVKNMNKFLYYIYTEKLLKRNG